MKIKNPQSSTRTGGFLWLRGLDFRSLRSRDPSLSNNSLRKAGMEPMRPEGRCLTSSGTPINIKRPNPEGAGSFYGCGGWI